MAPDDDMARPDDRLSAGNTGLISAGSSVFTRISPFGLMQTRRSATAVSALRSAKSRSQRIWSPTVTGDWADRQQAAISNSMAGHEYLDNLLPLCAASARPSTDHNGVLTPPQYSRDRFIGKVSGRKVLGVYRKRSGRIRAGKTRLFDTGPMLKDGGHHCGPCWALH